MSDLIDRQKTLEEIYRLPIIDRDAYEFYRDVRESIKSMPSAKPPPETCWGCNCPKMEEPKKGRWNVEHGVFMHDDIYGDIYRCSVCGYRERTPEGFIYCPNCGAKMEVTE